MKQYEFIHGVELPSISELNSIVKTELHKAMPDLEADKIMKEMEAERAMEEVRTGLMAAFASMKHKAIWLYFMGANVRIARIDAYYMEGLVIRVACGRMVYSEPFNTVEECQARFEQIDEIITK